MKVFIQLSYTGCGKSLWTSIFDLQKTRKKKLEKSMVAVPSPKLRKRVQIPVWLQKEHSLQNIETTSESPRIDAGPRQVNICLQHGKREEYLL
ncbi:hypothetical protein Y032_0020g234 [Ancylostoma ceylanicum]|uniref:Uncharacterized protein n=1 Tax=Ancylostoma ceylanicum TaxID=53326 RepID=A0A016V1L0_9BILA|nr:hypothetical protein Y032_0020g234 [Ancylostoma ceylanicum]